MQEAIAAGFYVLVFGGILVLTCSVCVYLLLTQLFKKKHSSHFLRYIFFPLISLVAGTLVTWGALWFVIGTIKLD